MKFYRSSIGQRLVCRRAAITLQRLWRGNLLRVRMHLLHRLFDVSRDIHSYSVFLDALAYYSLIRFQELAYVPRFYRRYPEFLCAPVISSDGKLMLRRAHFGTKPPKSNHAHPKRWGFPKWLGLTYDRAAAPPIARHDSGNACILKVFACISKTSICRFAMKGADYDVIKLDFSCVEEAKLFAVGLIVFTFDYLTKSCVTPMNEEFVMRRMQESKATILAHARSPLFTRHRYPIEASFPLQSLPPYLLRSVNMQNRNALVRFRFMMSALRKTITDLS